jgi:branched-chain amino acid transport system substrate-binding protein
MTMLKRGTLLLTLAATCIGDAGLAHADADTLRIGLIATYSGPYADYGRQLDDGIAVYLKEHDGKIAGKNVEIIKRDNEGAKPELAKRLAQELIVRDKVNFLAGLDFSPNAYAVASIASQAKIPTIVMNAASSGIPKTSPYIARVSFTVEQVTSPMAKYMLKNGIKSAYTVVADYAPGIDAEAEFVRSFTAGGGKIVGAVRTPMSNPDFSAFVQRIKDSQPQAVFFFFPSGQMPISFLKVWKERGLDKAGVKLFATGEATDDSFLEATGDVALNLVTSHHYSYAHPSPLNKRFIKKFADEFGTSLRPNYFAVAAYDGMAAIAAALEKTGGDTSGPKVMQALKGLKLESPRGPIEIDAVTRDIVQTVYIRNTERVEGKLINVERDHFDRVKDPLQEMHGVAH